MGYEDYIRVKLGYLESRFMIGFLLEKYEELNQLEKTPQIEEQIEFVRSVHNRIMKELQK
jgi:hypothetical protein